MTIKVKITRQENATYYGVNIGDVVEVDLINYIAGVVASEMGNASIEAAKAQAIAARTFAYPYYSKSQTITDASSTHQAFRTSRLTSAYANAKQAAIDTDGLVLTYNGTVINSCPYSNSNGGRTTSSQQRWGGYRAWLIEQDDPWDKAAGGTGNGHGVGMSQVGCHYAAKIGKTCEEILAFYYPGTKINVDGISSPTSQTETEVTNVATYKTVTARQFINQCNIPYNEGWGYIYGTHGQTWTQAKQKAATREQTVKWGSQWIGKMVTDCSGLLYWSMKQLGSYTYWGANTMWNSWTTNKGKITAGVKLRPGTAVFLCDMSRSKPRHHVGVYMGNGVVIEAKGTYYGVVKSKITDWDEWGELKYVDYSAEEYEDIPASYPTLSKGSRGESVKLLQEKLTYLKFLNDKIDGVFGQKTENAVKLFQFNNKLTADGVCGTITWKALLEVTSKNNEQNNEPETDEEQSKVDTETEIEIEKRELTLEELNKLVVELQKQVQELLKLHNIER